jgi:hypothetical protein
MRRHIVWKELAQVLSCHQDDYYGAVARMPWFTPEYLEARLREQEHERRLAEFETRMMKTPPRPTVADLLRQIARILKRR